MLLRTPTWGSWHRTLLGPSRCHRFAAPSAMDHVWFVSCYDKEKQHRWKNIRSQFVLGFLYKISDHQSYFQK